ncbi:MAG: hemolysin family protein [Ferrovibrio sp.]|uniref:hemolysin family protein n=1 Tax=Ferrovibrio sp. TaxID=1917215 RepID=UPI002606FA44|nr:hemolysin family protein [Ferrovibrio sp.]MCW0233696.1 hemolysin family protein [Ferrovibrio sp.]
MSETRENGGGGGTFWRRLLSLLRGRGDESLRDSIEELLEEHADDSATPEENAERALLRNVLEVGELRVGEIRVPRTDIIAVPAEIEFEKLVKTLVDAEHSRLPVYRGTLDDVVGMIHVKDVLPYLAGRAGFSLEKVLRKLLVVPPSKSVLELLREMRDTRVHMAIVVDEYGGLDGLVTIEDLVEQIVGEIDDEHDVAAGGMLIQRADGVLEALGRCPIEDLEEKLGHTLLDPEDDGDVDTVGGLIVSHLGRVPLRGEQIDHPAGLVFEVLEADPRRVKRVRIRTLVPQSSADAA